MSPLDAKLFRDLWRMKGQVLAIGLVIAMGVMMQVMMTGLVRSLEVTRDTYYERYRLAEVFAPVTRAPEHVAQRVAAIDGVTLVETRVNGMALVDIPGRVLPVSAQAISLPDQGTQRLNNIILTAGRMIDTTRPEEIVLLDSFAHAHSLQPGDRLYTTMNGARRHFRIVGLARSPEFLYTTAPGELVPDDSRFGVIWLSRSALSAAYDMEGAFNEILLRLSRNASVPGVLDAVDLILDNYGGRGAYALEDQFSNRFISQEIAGLKVSATSVPPVFLAVAAFLLYIVVSRMVQSEREEIGLMKAFGYTNGEVGWHYMKLVLFVALAGAFAGCLMGIGAGRALIVLYLDYFKFPFLVFQLDPASFILGVTASVFAASLGGLFVLRRVFALFPAEAMRPAAPKDYSGAGQIGRSLAERLDQPSRMVLRSVIRQPGRMAGAIIGIAAGMGLTLAMSSVYAGFDRTLELTFGVVDRSDATVTFTHPLGEASIFNLRRIEGVSMVEPVRHVPVVLRNERLTHRGAITGLTDAPVLSRAIDADSNTIAMPKAGIVLSTALSDILDIGPGDMLTIEVREGSQPTISVPVAAVASSLLGSPAYMDIGALNKVLGEPGRVSGAYLSIDPKRRDEIYATLKDMPGVAGVSLKSDARAAFETIMNQGAGSIRFVMGAIAFVITFGIVYNAARVAQAERARDLASLRVLGFHSGETAFVLLGELAIVILIALPLGSLIGHFLGYAVAKGFSTELYQIPSMFVPESHGFSAAVVVFAAFTSGWLVKRDLQKADMVATLKTRE